MKRDELNPVKLSLVLFIITAFSGLVLSLVYSVTKPKIQENEKRKEQQAIKIIMPAVKSFTLKDDYYLIYQDENKKQLIGYIFKTSAKGYGGPVKCNVGINLSGKITGIVIGSHSETPGLGTKIKEKKKGEKEPYYLKQFKNLTSDKINFIEIKAISGATISSKAVLKCVQMAFKKYQEIKK